MLNLLRRLPRAIAAVCAVALVVACAQGSPVTAQGRPASEPVTAVPNTDPVICKAQGGALQKVCRMGRLLCVIPYKDAGKTCTDKAQCGGECLYEGGDAKPGDKVTGTCQANNDPCGCKRPVLGGKLTDYGRCVD